MTKLGDPLSRECSLCSARVQGWGKRTGAETQSREPRETGERVPDRRAALQPRAARPSPARPPALLRCGVLTDEEDGEGDEEQEDVRDHIERVHEAAIVEDSLVHPVGGRVVLSAAEGQGHGGARTGSVQAPRASRASVPRSSQASCMARPAPSRPAPTCRWAPPRQLLWWGEGGVSSKAHVPGCADTAVSQWES